MRFAVRLTHFIIKYGFLFHLFLGLLLFWFYSESRKNINVIVKQVGFWHFLFCFVHWFSCLSSKYIILGAKHRETVNTHHTKTTVKLSVHRAEMFRRLTALGFSNPRSPFSLWRTCRSALVWDFARVQHTEACISCPACQLSSFWKRVIWAAVLTRQLTDKNQILYYSEKGHNHRYVVTAHSVTCLLCVKAPFLIYSYKGWTTKEMVSIAQ